MAVNPGGRQTPDNKPRPPAGPGKFSVRTDMSGPPTPQGAYAPTGMPYGDNQRLMEAQAVQPAPNNRVRPGAAPTQTGGGPATPAGMTPPALADLLARPTMYPDEPVTAGLAASPLPATPSGQPSQFAKIASSFTHANTPEELRGLSMFYQMLERLNISPQGAEAAALGALLEE